ncbi:MAG: Cell shape-determining protein MreC precursor [Bacteroidetes bacterium ADurb.Bin234]|nr:MAG: Cell shape-determining protein MreC precursor [Bacteroidetes bacterium ADurb.Bin234]
MRNILNFIWKNHFFFLFLLLETVCLVIVIQNNDYQRAAFINKTSEFFASVNKRITNIYDYFNLAEINRQLSEENARLRAQTITSFNLTDTNTFAINDTLYKQEYTYIQAKVVNNSINRRKNFITLNKGSNHGIKKDMGVISPQGVVGIVADVSPNYTTVMSLLHIDSKISAQLKNTNHIGSLVWEGINYRKGKLNDMPTHVVLHVGDTLVTSGFSAIFPQGIDLGYVLDFSLRNGEMFYDVDIAFTVDFNNLAYVYVVNNLLKEERSKLEKKTAHD